MTDHLRRLLAAPAVAGLLAGVVLAGMPTTASADTEGTSLAVNCRDGVCDSNDPEAATTGRRGFSLHRSSGTPEGPEPGWGGPVRRMAPWGAPMRRLAPKGAYKRGPGGYGPAGYGPAGYQKVGAGAVCSADHASGDVALLCDNDVKNDLWINISQWGYGNQVNVAVFFQNISQFAASGSGNATNTATDNDITATLTQTNQDS